MTALHGAMVEMLRESNLYNHSSRSTTPKVQLIKYYPKRPGHPPRTVMYGGVHFGLDNTSCPGYSCIHPSRPVFTVKPVSSSVGIVSFSIGFTSPTLDKVTELAPSD